MLKKNDIDKLAGMLTIDAEVLAKAITDEKEVDITIPDLKFFKNEDLELLLDNRGKERYEAGKTAEREMLFKDLSKEAGLETIKDKNDFIKAYKGKILEEAKIEPEKKVKELETSLANLQKQVQEEQTKYVNLESQIKTEKTKFKVQSLIPEIPETVGLNKEEATSLFFMNYEVKDDGVYKNGTLLKDNLERPLDITQAVTGFLAEKGWNKQPSGRGGGAPGAGGNFKITTMEEFQAHLKEKGIQEGSAEANSLLAKVAKETPEILN